jgi:alpha-L-fucosidase
LLNLPPDRRGLLHENDVKSLLEWKKLKDTEFAKNLAEHAPASADKYRGKSKQYAAANVTDGDKETYWATDDNVLSGSIVVDLGKTQILKYLSIQEYIRLGQRVKNFDVDVWKDNKWVKAATGTTIGHKRILPLEAVESSKIRINITDSKACPLISTIEVY